MNKQGIKLRHFEGENQINSPLPTPQRKKIFQNHALSIEMSGNENKLLNENIKLRSIINQKNTQIEYKNQIIGAMKSEIQILKQQVKQRKKQIIKLSEQLKEINVKNNCRVKKKPMQQQQQQLVSPLFALNPKKKSCQPVANYPSFAIQSQAAHWQTMKAPQSKKILTDSLSAPQRVEISRLSDSREFKFEDYSYASISESGFGVEPY